MNKRLENFVRDHRQEFDVFEPSDSVWKGIERQIDLRKRTRLTYILTRVAAVAAIFILSFTIQKYFWRNNEIVIPELQEAEVYYSGLINMKMDQLQSVLSENPEIEKELKSDMMELDSVYVSLKEDLKDNIANQDVLEAMIENYRLRIDILEEMVLYLEVDQDDTKSNNKTKYEL